MEEKWILEFNDGIKITYEFGGDKSVILAKVEDDGFFALTRLAVILQNSENTSFYKEEMIGGVRTIFIEKIIGGISE